MLIKENKVIKEIDFTDNLSTIKTFPVHWQKSITIVSDIQNLKISTSEFEWFGKENLKGYILEFNNGNKYYLVIDFFDNIDDILKKMNIN